MKNILLRLRYWMEFFAFPVFAFLVIHLAGHGIMIFLEDEHDHAHHHGSGHEHGFDIHGLLEMFFSVEVLSGILLGLMFVWIWHRPKMKKWVPCSHEHCHKELPLPHLLATAALCLHFFPEAGVRHMMLEKALNGDMFHLLGFVGFLAHFVVDLVATILLSLYWKTNRARIISFLGITMCWFLALFVGLNFWDHVPEGVEGTVFLLSAFFLAMFVHAPHKPVLDCKSCKC